MELCWSNQWKAVCDDGWGLEEAITVCRELGYLNGNGMSLILIGETNNIMTLCGSHTLKAVQLQCLVHISETLKRSISYNNGIVNPQQHL